MGRMAVRSTVAMIRGIYSFGRSAEEGCLLTPSEGVKKKRMSGEVQDGVIAARG